MSCEPMNEHADSAALASPEPLSPEQNDDKNGGYPDEDAPKPTVTEPGDSSAPEPGDSSAPGANESVVLQQQAAPEAKTEASPATLLYGKKQQAERNQLDQAALAKMEEEKLQTGQLALATPAEAGESPGLVDVPPLLVSLPSADLRCNQMIQTFESQISCFLDPERWREKSKQNENHLWSLFDEFNANAAELKRAATKADVEAMKAKKPVTNTKDIVEVIKAAGESCKFEIEVFKATYDESIKLMKDDRENYKANLADHLEGVDASCQGFRRKTDTWMDQHTAAFKKNLMANLEQNKQRLELYDKSCQLSLMMQEKRHDQDKIEAQDALEIIRKQREEAEEGQRGQLALYKDRQDFDHAAKEKDEMLSQKILDTVATRHLEERAALEAELAKETERFNMDFKVATEKVKDSRDVDLKWDRPRIDWQAKPPCIVQGWVRCMTRR